MSDLRVTIQYEANELKTLIENVEVIFKELP